MITPQQCIAARALLGWNQPDLSRAIRQSGGKLSVTAITNFETGKHMRLSNKQLIKKAFELYGVDFLEAGDIASGAGVALRY